MERIKSFPPVADENTRLLILGSMPGPMSLQMSQYYAFKNNQFWRIMGNICGFEPDISYEQRLVSLQKNHIGLWDVIASCERQGALDSNIRREIYNPVKKLIGDMQISAVAFNGRKSGDTFRRHILTEKAEKDFTSRDKAVINGREIILIDLPSTSPAYASLSFEQKLAVWREKIIGFIR